MLYKLFTTFSLLFALVVAIFLGNQIAGLSSQIGEKDRGDFIDSLLQKSSSVSAAEATSVTINNNKVLVEIADTPAKRAEGLMNRNFMPFDRGMLFLFPRQGRYDFWMKDTKIALDIIWIDENLKIVHIEENVKPCVELLCPRYGSAKEALYVLEVNSNWANKANVRVGDNVIFK
jgi:uncharacterized membrane protein (UPF0127 family)